MKPVCCGKNATPYKKLYGGYDKFGVWHEDLSWEEGFKCLKCKRIRIPWETDLSKFLPFAPFSDEQLKILLDNLTSEGIIFNHETIKRSHCGHGWIW